MLISGVEEGEADGVTDGEADTSAELSADAEGVVPASAVLPLLTYTS